MSILSDELRSNLKVETVSKRRVLKLYFVNYLLTSLLHYVQLKALFLCRSLHRTDAERGDTAPGESDLALAGEHWRHLPTEWKLRFFSQKVARFVRMHLLWKKVAKRVWKLVKIVLKSRLCVWDAGADGRGGGYLWRSVDIVAGRHK